MKLIKINLVIAYDGTAYQGWQWQRIGLGVQQRVEEALAKLFKSAPRLHSSSRTDAGVHALGMAAHVEIPDDQIKMPAAKMAVASAGESPTGPPQVTSTPWATRGATASVPTCHTLTAAPAAVPRQEIAPRM